METDRDSGGGVGAFVEKSFSVVGGDAPVFQGGKYEVDISSAGPRLPGEHDDDGMTKWGELSQGGVNRKEGSGDIGAMCSGKK